MAGKVWLVGAGPGDAGLMTIKGREVLSRAEVVVYDALVGDGVLGMIPEGAKRVFAGKRSGNHFLKQEETNRVLLEEALSGKRVVRLKGGDPFVFGRGGEELELLVEHGVPYEIVPGVTSAFAAPAYHGIPVTHRDYCTGFFYDAVDHDPELVTENGYEAENSFLTYVEREVGDHLYLCRQKNKFSPGEPLEYLTPGQTGRDLTVYSMTDEDGHNVENCPHPKMPFLIKTDQKLQPGDMIRRKL